MADKIDDGGPAFARPSSQDGNGPRAEFFTAQDGLSIRDYFAAAALQGLLAYWRGSGSDEPTRYFPRRAYEYADAMLAARKKGGG